MDRLTACMIAAKYAGMSYGQYMATHRAEIPEDKKEDKKEETRSKQKEHFQPVCVRCGYPIGSIGNRTRYCSDKCRTIANRERARERARTLSGLSKNTEIVCRTCGKKFVLGDRNAHTKYCSEKCRKYARSGIEVKCYGI